MPRRTSSKNIKASSSQGPRPKLKRSRAVPSPKALSKGNLAKFARMSKRVALRANLRSAKRHTRTPYR
jgi:hypothetical protein